ncbi:MAG: hypothetical protein WAQ27_00830 [Candidatus Microsaccharimonas sp.]
MKRLIAATAAMAVSAALLLTGCAGGGNPEPDTVNAETNAEPVKKITDPRDGWVLVGSDQVLADRYHFPYVRAICMGPDLMVVATDYRVSESPILPVFQTDSELCGPE